MAVPVPGLAPTTGLFESSDDAAARFWAWWDEVCVELTHAVGTGAGGEWTAKLDSHIRDMHPRIQWDLRRGTTARFALCLTGSGDTLVRLVIERWRRCGPKNGVDWEFRTTRPASSSANALVVNIAGEQVALSDMRVIPRDDPARERVHCTVYHPVFRRLPSTTRDSLAVLLLDHAVGEAGVETWMGAIDTTVDAPDGDGRDIEGLRRVVAARQETATGLHWGVTTKRGPEGTLFQIVNYAMKRWAFPTFDARCDITFQLERPTPAGIPDPWESEAFEGIEEGLSRALHGHAVLVARTSGRQRHVVHLYAEQDGIAPDAISAWARRVQRNVEVRWTFDPEWSLLTSQPS